MQDDKGQAKSSVAQTRVQQDESERTISDEHTQYSMKLINDPTINYIKINGLNQIYYQLFDLSFPANSLEKVVQQIRDVKKPIIWVIGNMSYRASNNRLYLYKNELFWKLIGNQDILSIYDWNYFDEIYEQLITLIQRVQLQSIYFRFNAWVTKNLDDILEIIKNCTQTRIFVNYYNQQVNNSDQLIIHPSIDKRIYYYEI